MDKNKKHLPEMPKEKDYLIVYIDLLGTKERLAKKDGDEIFKKIYFPFLFADKVFPSMGSFDVGDIKTKIFSDNILFAYPINNFAEKEEVFSAYKKMTLILKFFLSMFVSEGILFRGAITIGKLLINEVMVWGEDLVTVVKLEEKVAIYPRIILSEELLRVFDKFGLSGSHYEKKFSCMKDYDNCVFFDFFDYEDAEAMDSYLPSAIEHIENNIRNEKKRQNRANVLQKYNWFRNYLYDVEKIYTETSDNKNINGDKYGTRNEKQWH